MSEITEKKKEKFFKVLSTGASVTKAARLARISRAYVYVLRETDVEFAKLWDEAIEEGTDTLEDTALKFANKGDSSLIKFLLGARRPELYRERKDINLSGSLCFADLLDDLEGAANGSKSDS